MLNYLCSRSIAKANGKFRSAGRANEREFYLTLVKINLLTNGLSMFKAKSNTLLS